MKLNADAFDGIQEYLDTLPPKVVAGGRSFYQFGQVNGLKFIEEGRFYSATVRSKECHEVELDFFDGEWTGECTCRVGFHCNHIVAVLLALQESASAKAVTESGKKKQNPQPSGSQIYERLAGHLGRELRKPEEKFILLIQKTYANIQSRPLWESDLLAILGHTSLLDYWKPLDIWPASPRDDWHFWLFIAWELRRRGLRYPSFMADVTDLKVIEPEMTAWEREKEMEKWRKWFGDFDGQVPVSQPSTLELRLVVLPEEARLQWRRDAQSEYSEFKPELAKSLAQQFEHGTLTLDSQSLLLWAATYKPWDFEKWWLFKYSNATNRPALNRLLRMPLSPAQMVAGNGQPLPKFAEPLRLILCAPKEDNGDYELTLATPDSLPLPKIYCTLAGNPTLYLTERGLYAGPPASRLDIIEQKRIPASAIETAEGLRFLHSAGVPPPEHLAQRVKTVPVTVTIACEMKLAYPGSRSEEIIITVTAKAPGMTPEQFFPSGWAESYSNATDKMPPLAKGKIAIYDRAAQAHFPRVIESLPDLKRSGFQSDWRLRLTKKTPEYFAAWVRSLPPEIELKLDPELATLRDEPLSGSVSLDVSEAGMDWFDLKVALKVSDTKLTPAELKLLLQARGGYVRLGNKGWRKLQYNLTPQDDEQLARLGLDARDFSDEPQRFHALQLADEAAKRFLAPDHIEKIQRRASELKTRVSPPTPTVIRAELRPYQTEGFHFLTYLAVNRFGGVLADDMGLGKTLQTLTWLAWLRESGASPQTESAADMPAVRNEPPPTSPASRLSNLPALVVCPKSVMDNWRAEAERFYPGLRTLIWRGETSDELAGGLANSDLVIINYTQLRLLSPGIADIAWQVVILDEAQYIKSPDSQTAQAARALKSEHRLALTGTPIENRLLDLWSILCFAMPGALGSRAQFLRRFNGKEDPLARRRLAARVRPFLLRRTKSQVARELPERIEEDLLCEMEGEQKALYLAELKRARQIVLGLKTHQQLNAERFNILTSLLRLRQICCHPALVSKKLRQAESAKLSALEDLLEPLMEEGHKVLVFSQFVGMLDLLRESVEEHKWPYFYLDGSTEDRGNLVKDFQEAKGGAVFLISLKAGGFGLNLTAASYVVLFDPWWNPAVENQAIDRTHRIGQTSQVMAYRLLMAESIEEKIRALQKRKNALADDVLGEERFAQSLTLEDLRFLFAD